MNYQTQSVASGASMLGERIFSIVIPCYNQACFLQDCLESLRSQTYSYWKAVVVDDAGPDGQLAARVVESFGDPRCTLVRHPINKGLAASRNTGISKGMTPYVLPVDADDMLAPTYLERAATILDNNDQVDCVFPDFKLFGEHEGVWTYTVPLDSDLGRAQCVPGPGVAMRRSLWEKVGGYCEAPEIKHYGNEDWDFWLSAVELGFNANHIPEPLYCYRQHGRSMSRSYPYNEYKSREFLYRRHLRWFEENRHGTDFRITGFLNSASASLESGERLRAFVLSGRALVLSPGRSTLKAVLRAAVPDVVRVPCAKFWRTVAKRERQTA